MNDLISRQAAMDAVCEELDSIDHVPQWVFDRLTKKIEKLPSAQPKAIRPKYVAEDRYLKNHFQIFPRCPKCNYELETGDCYCRVCGCHIDWSEEDEE